MKSIGIIGYGWLGKRLANHFLLKYKVSATSRNNQQADNVEMIHLDFDQENLTLSEKLIQQDALIITVTYPKAFLSQWINKLHRVIGDYSGQLYLSSTTGIYEDQEGIYTEDSYALKEPWASFEKEFKNTFAKANILRLGGLMGDDRYLSKYFINRPLIDPGARVNYIHYTDIALILEQLIEAETRDEIFNLVAPHHPRKSEVFFNQTGTKIEGEEFARIISSEKIIKKIGYTFVYPDPKFFPFNVQN